MEKQKDMTKMADFFLRTKSDFLKRHQHLTEKEYDNTIRELNNLAYGRASIKSSTDTFYQVEPLIGIDEFNVPVEIYEDALCFEQTEKDNKDILCWGLYRRKPEEGEMEHLADFYNEDEANAICDLLNK